MKKMRGPTVAAVFLALAPSLATAPTVALAGGFHGGAVRGHVIAGGRPFAAHPFGGRPFVSRPFVPHHFFPRPFFHRHFFRPFIPFGVIASPVVVFAPPPVYSAPPTYDDPPVAYGSPVGGTASVPPPPPPSPSVIEYPTGRYELRGDGVTTPFAWVWIPKPPPPPPGPPAAPQGAPADPTAKPIEPQSSTRLYRWIDDQGVTHWTNMPNTIPERHRLEVERPVQPGGDRV